MQQHDFTFDHSDKNKDQAIVHSEEVKDLEEVKEQAQSSQSLGRRLLYARKSLNISAEDIADSMRVPLVTIKAIEADDYTSVNNVVFLRGYIRGYAKLVHIPDQEIESLFIQLGLKQPIVIHKPSKFETRQISPGDKPIRLITYVIMLILIVLIIAWLYAHHSEENAMTQANITTANATSQQAAPLVTTITPTVVQNANNSVNDSANSSVPSNPH